MRQARAYATQTIALSGAAPVATVSATMLAFGPQQVQTASAPQQVTLTNTGSAALVITNIAVAGDQFFGVRVSESVRRESCAGSELRDRWSLDAG